MRKIIMNLIRDILMELGLVITLLLMTLVVALNYDTHPVLCALAIIVGMVTAMLIIQQTYLMVLSFEILILCVQGYMDKLIIKRMLLQCKEEVNSIKNCCKIIDEITDNK